MARKVVTAPKAAEDLRNARLWLLQPGSGAGARGRWNALLRARRRLADHPYSGRRNEEHEGCRVLTVSGHRIVYQVVPDTGDAATAGEVQVLRIFGPGQLGRQL